MQHSALFDLCLSEEGFLEAGEKSGSSMMEWAITAGSILNPGSTNIVWLQLMQYLDPRMKYWVLLSEASALAVD